MRLITEVDKNLWQEFIRQNIGCAGWEFILSPDWVDTLHSEGQEIKILAVANDQQLLSFIVLVKKFLNKKFFYWYAPRGPLLNNDLSLEQATEATKFLLTGIRRLDKRALFIKLEPANKTIDFWQNIFSTSYFFGVYRVRRVADVQPCQTLILDLKKSEAELLAQMHPKTRYNIRLAEKKGIKIVKGSAADFSEFWRLMMLTGGRDGFRLHPAKHYENLLSNNDFINLFFAEYKGEKVATALMSIFWQQATYLHGGSNYEKRQLMAPYLLQWEMIKQAKINGAFIYDFYGIHEEKWPGVTRFKQGFQGEKRNYPGAFDVIFRPAMYRLYQLVKFVRQLVKNIKKYVPTHK